MKPKLPGMEFYPREATQAQTTAQPILTDEQRGVIMAVAWYYHDEATGVRYYTESYTMSVTEFAEVVSRLVGHKVSASDTSQAQRWKDLERFSNTKHI